MAPTRQPKRITRRQALKIGLSQTIPAGLLTSLWLSGCREQPAQKRPNIILIVIDTLRTDHVGCCGCQRNTTPNIDKLASQGLLFKNALVASPWTVPSVASILTSQYPSVLGITDRITVVDDSFPTLPEMLKRHGYATHGIISTVMLSENLGFNKGFDGYDESPSAGHSQISSPHVTQRALSFLRQSPEQPFFLLLYYFDPHYNYVLHNSYDYFPGYKGPLKSNQTITELWQMRQRLSENDIRYLLSLYDSEITFTDYHVGKLLLRLKQMGLYDNSIIILTADHGEEFMERGWIGHTITLYQELIRVPLIMKLPGFKPRTITQPVGLIDIVPTICKYLALDAGASLEGTALIDRSESQLRARPLFSETFNPQSRRAEAPDKLALRSVVQANRKLVCDYVNGSAELFDLSKDARETNDLSAAQPDQKARLNALLDNYIRHIEEKRSERSDQPGTEVLTPQQRKELESLGYI